MPNRPLDSAEATAREACREVPAGAAHEECLLWTAAEVKIAEQVAADRADLFVIMAIIAPLVLLAVLIYKRAACAKSIWRGWIATGVNGGATARSAASSRSA